MYGIRRLKQFTVAAVLSLTASSAFAEITFDKVVDIDTRIPGGTGYFSGFGVPQVSDDSVVFTAHGSSDQSGIYRWVDGQIEMVVDDQATPPGSTNGSYSFFREIAIDGEDIAFTAFIQIPGTTRGIYKISDGMLSLIADGTTVLPGDNRLRNLRSPAIENGRVVFQAETTNRKTGIYSHLDDDLTVIADTSTQVPGGEETFRRLEWSAIDDGEVVFIGHDSQGDAGIYREVDGQLTRLVQENETLDTDGQGIGAFGSLTVSNGTVAVRSSNSDQEQGLYTLVDGDLSLIATATSFVPSLEPRFPFGRNDPVVDDDSVVFWAESKTGYHGLFLQNAGITTKIVDSNDTLDGKMIRTIEAAQAGALRGDRLAFVVGFVENRADVAIYVANVPEPSEYGGLMLPWFAALARHLRRLNGMRRP